MKILSMVSQLSLFLTMISGASAEAGTAQQLLAGKIDVMADTITLPLYQGMLKDGRSVWYIITDADSKMEAERLGVVYAPELTNAGHTTGVRSGAWYQGSLLFAAGTVDFNPAQQIVPGDAPHAFPPKSFQPGSLGDAAYSPFVAVQTANQQVIYNAPMLAFNVNANAINYCNGGVDHKIVHDHVVRICPQTHEVTLKLSHGFAGGRALVYLSFDANNPMAATMEASTYAPALDVLKNTNSSLDIFAVANGQTGKVNNQRQGFDSALSGDGSPLNVLEGLPDAMTGYSPLWDLHLGAWSPAAIAAGKNVRLTSSGQFYNAVQGMLMTGPGGGSFGSTGILINCPVVAIEP